MATETGIKRDISEIAKEIADLKKQSSDAAQEIRSLKVDLQFNPASVENITKKYQALRSQLEITTKLQATYKEQLQALQARKQTETGNAAKKTQREIEKLANTIKKTALTIKTLEYESSKSAEALEKQAVATEKLNKKMQPLEDLSKKTAKAAAALVASLTLLVKKTIDAGNELYSLSVRYEASAESLQRYNRQLEIATGQTDLYSNALAALSNGLKEIVSGRGVAYEQALKNIGLSSKELLELNMEERYQRIFEALQNVTDESVRTANAQKLLGDSGAYIAQVAGMTADEMERVNAMTAQYGILTDKQVKQLHDAYISWQNFKSQLMIIGAEIIPIILPLLQKLADFIGRVADGLDQLGKVGTGVLLTMLGFATILPKIIAFTKSMVLWSTLHKIAKESEDKAIKKVTASTIALNTVSMNWQIILLAVAGVVMLILSLLGKARKQTSDASDEMSRLLNQANQLNGIGGDFASSAETTTTYMNERTININAEFYGHGDTFLSDDSASRVATLAIDQLVDQMQKDMGNLIK